MNTVLITDDSATARMIVRRCLEIAGLSGWRFLEAANGEDALQIMTDNVPDILVTDLNMPKMNGEELLTAVSSEPGFKRVAVFVITSACNPAREKELLEKGAVAVLGKPVSPAVLSRALGPYLPQSNRSNLADKTDQGVW